MDEAITSDDAMHTILRLVWMQLWFDIFSGLCCELFVLWLQLNFFPGNTAVVLTCFAPPYQPPRYLSQVIPRRKKRKPAAQGVSVWCRYFLDPIINCLMYPCFLHHISFQERLTPLHLSPLFKNLVHTETTVRDVDKAITTEVDFSGSHQ